MTKHTPGPWMAYETEDGRIRVSDSGEDIFPVAEILGVDAEANAQLIAAAPELLAIVKLFVDGCDAAGIKDFNIPYLPDARAAIAKAQGVSRTT